MNRLGEALHRDGYGEEEGSNVHAPASRRGSKGRLIVVSNRVASAEGPHAGGLGQAMRSALANIGGMWFGWSGTIAEQPLLHVRREGAVRFLTRDLSPDEHRDYYVGYANRVLWPLLHGRLDLVSYRPRALAGYLRVNAAFADEIRKIARPDDLVWIHDYHLIPLARMLRDRGVACRIGFFLHVPVPPPATLAALPGEDNVLHALAACDLVGTQTDEDARNLREFFARARLRPCGAPDIRPFPIGIDVDAMRTAAEQGERVEACAQLRASLGGQSLLLGVDRLDYSKGLPERLRSYARLLQTHPELRGRVTLLQIAPRTRAMIPEYVRINRKLQRIAGSINGRYADETWTPVRYLNRCFAQHELTALYRAAKVGVVTPLRDGMNLVAKEYVACQDENDPGVLVLSRFAGAACELAGALVVNPFDPDQCAEAMHAAIGMPLAERRQRWRSMMSALSKNDIHGWRDGFLAALDASRASAAHSDGMHDTREAVHGDIRLRARTPDSTALTITHLPPG